jgi:hypothetical protein
VGGTANGHRPVRAIAAAARLVGEQLQMIENGLILVTTFIAQQGRD